MNKKLYPKKITIFLIDGLPEGRIACELSNWTGKSLKIPKIMLKDSSDRIELQNPGVYFLFGKSLEHENKDMVYIGESEILFDRIKNHIATKEFWNEVVVVFSKDDNLNKAHVKYLEYKLYELAKNNGRYLIENSNVPKMPSISEADKAEMEEFTDNILLLIKSMGYKLFTEIEDQLEITKTSYYYIDSARNAKAKGQPTQEGFIVYKDSQMASETVPSIPKWIENIRTQLIEDKVVINENGNLKFTHNHLFNSPSASAAVIMGRSANGLKEWKNKDGISLGEVESSEI